ncbi:hypothetical protein CRYUN_Cryun04dG0180600 [Craigia yunnanensis]
MSCDQLSCARIGCDAAAIINILAHRDATQRSLIQQEYETTYSDELRKHLSSQLTGHLKKAVLLWMHEPGARDAYIAKKAVRGKVKDHKAVSEITCFRTSSQIGQLKRAYFINVGTNLEDDIESEASGHHRKVFPL